MTDQADTQSQQTADTSGQTQGQNQDQSQNKAWYSGLPADLANNPTVQKYKSAEDQVKGHLELVSKLGSDRVAWPKDANDKAGWAEVNKRLGVPEKAEGYKLPNVDMPKELGIPAFDKNTFGQMMKDINATPAQAAKLWENYTGSLIKGFNSANETYQKQVEGAKAALQQEWGEAYQTKIQRGQQVIDAFSSDAEQRDAITAMLAKEPGGLKFLASIGDKMAESSIGGFQDKKAFTLTPDEAKLELSRLKANPDYRSDSDRVRGPLVERANDLMKLAYGGTRQESPAGF